MLRKKMRSWFRTVQDERNSKLSPTWSVNSLHDVLIDDVQKLTNLLMYGNNGDKAILACADIANATMILAYKMHKESGKQSSLPLDCDS